MSTSRKLQYSLALNEALHQMMESDPSVFLIGQGVKSPWYVGNTAQGLLERFGETRGMLKRANVEFDKAIARKPDFAQAHFYLSDLYAHFLIDAVPGKPAGVTSPVGLSIAQAQDRLLADLDAANRYERDPDQRRVIQVIRTSVSADWRALDGQIAQAYASWDNCRHGLWIDQTAIILGHGEEVLAHDARRARCDPIGGNWTREAITAVWMGRAEEGLAAADRIEARRGPDRDVAFTRVLAYLALGRLDEAEALYVAADLGAPDAPTAMSLLALQIPAAAGQAGEWERLSAVAAQRSAPIARWRCGVR